MAEFLPFCGWRYNEDAVGPLTAVTSPPYDIISPEQQDTYYRRHPNNVVRLVLNRRRADDSPINNPHTRAAAHFENWCRNGVLLRDRAPAYYLIATDFTFEGMRHTRFGLIGLTRVEPFEKGIVLPHERTFSKVKDERLGLLKTTRANFCPIFSLFSDAEGVLDDILAAVGRMAPTSAFTDDQGFSHRLWPITDGGRQARVHALLKEVPLYIADGHHRYETALNYRNALAESLAGFDDTHPANFVMMYLCRIEDPGLIILPAHRLVKNVPQAVVQGFIAGAGSDFSIERYPMAPGQRRSVTDRFLSDIRSGAGAHAFGVVIHGDPDLYRLTIRPGVMTRRFDGKFPEALLDLDVTLITRLVLTERLGFDTAHLDEEAAIGYVSDADRAVTEVVEGRYAMGIVLNPTRIDQVQAVSRRGLIMPRKSTYFYPKAVTGQLFYRHEG